MSDPEVVFHRFFQSEALSYTNRARYRGKQDLGALVQPELRSALADIQVALNEALRNEKQGVREHVAHPPFHFDYVQSRVPNALAFQFEGFSFIGITMELVYMLWDAGYRLSQSEALAAVLGVSLTQDSSERTHVLLLGTELAFVVAHEYTHHVHGHVGEFRSEFLDEPYIGNLDRQAHEVDADCYAVYHVLADLIDGNRRSHALKLLNLEDREKNFQDQFLFSSVIVAIGAFLYALRPAVVDNATVYRLSHPPQAARLNFIMHSAINWCSQNEPALVGYMNLERFQAILAAVELVAREMNGGFDWSGQTGFLGSPDGANYIGKLDRSLKTHIQSL